MTQQRIDTAKEPKGTEPAKKKKDRKAKGPNPASSDGPPPSDSSASSSTAPTDQTEGFEAELRRLEETVADLEGGDLPLEDALGLYERGVALTRQLQQTLADAEQKVKVLSEEDEG